MKITYSAPHGFTLQHQKQTLTVDLTADQSTDIALFTAGDGSAPSAQKVITLPGEYEVNEILVKGTFESTDRTNTLYRCTLGGLSVLLCGQLSAVPTPAVLSELGENFDVILLPANASITAKLLKKIIETISPKLALVVGESTHTSGLADMMPLQHHTEPTYTVKATELPLDATTTLLWG